MDDALSWMPARLTALALALAAGGLNLWRLRREASLTPSPNSGWPMAAMAIAIGVRLHKPDVYMLNEAGREPRAADTVAAIRLATHALVWLAGLVVAVQAMVGLGGVSWLVGVFL
jgi:adenosylcobinamide-phosphate synthase